MSKTLIYKEDLLESIPRYCPEFLVQNWVKKCIHDAPPVDTLMKEADLIYLRHLLFNRQLEIARGTERGYVSPGEKERIKRLWDLLSDEITRKAERSIHAAIFPEKPEYLSDSLHMKGDPTREIRNPNSDEYNIIEVPKGVGIPYIVVGSSGVYLTKEYADVNRRLDSLNDLAREIHNTDSE